MASTPAQYRDHEMLSNTRDFTAAIMEAMQCGRLAAMDAIGGSAYWRREAAIAAANATGFASK